MLWCQPDVLKEASADSQSEAHSWKVLLCMTADIEGSEKSIGNMTISEKWHCLPHMYAPDIKVAKLTSICINVP